MHKSLFQVYRFPCLKFFLYCRDSHLRQQYLTGTLVIQPTRGAKAMVHQRLGDRRGSFMGWHVILVFLALNVAREGPLK